MISFHSCNRRCVPRKWNLFFKWITVCVLTAWSAHGQRPFKGSKYNWVILKPLYLHLPLSSQDTWTFLSFTFLFLFFCYDYSLLAFVSSAWSHIFVFIFSIRTFIKLHFLLWQFCFVVWQMTNSLFIVLLSLCVECFGKGDRYYDCSHLWPSFY